MVVRLLIDGERPFELSRAGVGPLHVTNRNAQRAERLAEAYGARPADFPDLATALRDADLTFPIGVDDAASALAATAFRSQGE